MTYTDAQRQRITQESPGKIVESLEWEEDGAYWVMAFTDETEISFRLMAELVNP